MASITVDQCGIRIKTDVLTSGYLRQEIERIYKILIPSEIKQLCFDYWFINICDEWDVELCKHERVEIDAQTVKTANKTTQHDNRNVFGCCKVSSGQFVWKLLLRKVIGFISIGVICEHLADQNPVYANYALDGQGVCVECHGGTLCDY